MPQVSKYPISKEVYETIFEVFARTFAGLNSRNILDKFVDEFLTPTERIMLAKRLAIGLLLAKDYNYREISKILRVSTTTVATVAILYKYGKWYKAVIRRILEDEKFEEFWVGVAEKIAGILSMAGSKGGSWFYLREEIRKKKRKKPF